MRGEAGQAKPWLERRPSPVGRLSKAQETSLEVQIHACRIMTMVRSQILSPLLVVGWGIAMVGAFHDRSVFGAEWEGSLDPFFGEPVMETQQILRHGRSQVWPNIVVALDGSVLATYGVAFGGGEPFARSPRHVALRRSENGGETWGKEIVIAAPGFQGGGTLVDETTGDILAFVEERHPPAPLTVYRSQDHGRTWKAQADTVVKPDRLGNVPSMHMNEHGITLRHGRHRGRLLRAARWYAGRNQYDVYEGMYTTAVYSDDGGRTWLTSEPFPENGTGEAAVAELSTGRIYYSSRMHWFKRPQNRRRRAAWSNDGGQSWRNWEIVEALPDGQQGRVEGCLGGLVRLPVKGRDILIYSNVDTETFDRNRITVWASFDGAQTWPVKRLVYGGPSGYSSLTAGRPGTLSEGWIYLHYHGGADHDDPVGKAHLFIPPKGSLVARFNLSWLLEGLETGDGRVPEWLRNHR